jgi:hypothetical protein
MTTYYGKDPSMVARAVAGEMILVPVRQNVSDLQCMYTLNNVGSRIWELLDGGVKVEEIVTTITQEYEVEAPQAEADVLEFLAQMKDIGAVVEKADRGH